MVPEEAKNKRAMCLNGTSLNVCPFYCRTGNTRQKDTHLVKLQVRGSKIVRPLRKTVSLIDARKRNRRQRFQHALALHQALRRNEEKMNVSVFHPVKDLLFLAGRHGTV